MEVTAAQPHRAGAPAAISMKLLERAAMIAAGLAFAGLVALHLLMIATEAPMEMRDGAMLATTLALLDGRNPYAIPGLMQTGNVYGIGYPLIALPFCRLLGASYSTLHLVSALGIAGAVALVFRWLRGAGVGPADALLGAGLAYAGLIYFTGAVARPDGVGTFLMLASVEVMRRGGLRPRAYAGGLALSLVGLVCKVYFVWPAFAAAAYVFLRGERRLGLAYAAAAIGGTAATLLAVGLALPGHTAFVLVANLAASDYDLAYMLQQSGEWLLFELPVIAALVVVLALAAWSSRRPQAPRLAGIFPAMAGLGAVAIGGALGGHTGAHLSYFFQILSPFVIVVALALAAPIAPARRAFRLALPLAIVANAHLFPIEPGRFADAEAAFAQARGLIDGSRSALATTEFAGTLALEGRPVQETGHAAYFQYATRAQLPSWLAPIVPSKTALLREWRRTYCGIRDKLRAGAYDLALTDPAPSGLVSLDLLRRRYEVVRTIVIDMPWALQRWPVRVWRPRSGAAAPAAATGECAS